MKKINTQEKLYKIRKRMAEEQIDAYLVLSTDFHDSEYVGDYFKCREYISGFTGSAGSVVILQNEAVLWTDGRYFLQAEKELEGSGIQLFRMGEEKVPEIKEYLKKKLSEFACVGVDGRTISKRKYYEIKDFLYKKQITLRLDCDLVGDIWQDRPSISCSPVWELELNYAGSSRMEKLTKIRKKLNEEGATCSIISSLDDIAWTLNIRGMDVACTPVVLSFLVVEMESAIWFVQKKAVNKKIADSLAIDGIVIREYMEIGEFVSKELYGRTLYLDPDRTNMMVYHNAQMSVKNTGGKIVEGRNITLLLKAVKNPIEIENMRNAHKKDAVACIKLIYWLKKRMKKYYESEVDEQITEISVAEKLENLRLDQKHYLGPSFNTIVGYAQHGAIVHYSAVPASDISLEPKSFLLVDSGGHYLEGTTDITRTIALGTLTKEQKHYYTLVLKGNIRLASAKFKYGCAGINLDYLARQPLWEEGLDYNHGTGHGVGYLLSVHEAPNCFRSKISNSQDECVPFETGMITSNEPGIYLPGAYGIRIENLLLCKEIESNEYGRFMGFETLTLVPFETDAILVEELDEKERTWLNSYHKKVFHVMERYLDSEERDWLKKVTAEI